jgi:D-lactate dehydrogenase
MGDKMKIAFFETEKWEEKYLKERIKNHELIFFKDELNSELINTVKDIDVLSVFIYSRVKKEFFEKLKKLKAVVTRSTGFDHIDLEEAKKRKIKVFYVPNYGENTVAEHTFALILDLSRKIHKSYERTVRGNFEMEGLRGFDLKGKTIGIVGMGSIGEHVARIAKGFQMNVISYSIKKDLKLSRKLGFKYVSLENLLKNSDIVTLHCPYNKSTHHMINKKTIKLMKKDSYIINTARGGVIDTTALVEALARKEIKGAALDVLEEEAIIKEEIQLLSKNFSKENLKNLVENHILLTFDNVIITPHNAFNSTEALERILDTTIDNIKSIEKRKKSKNIVK